MWTYRKYSIKSELLVYQEKEISPIPRKVFYNSITIGFCPKSKETERNSEDIRQENSEGKLFWKLPASEAKNYITNEVLSEYNID